jgi:hypothetical protein
MVTTIAIDHGVELIDVEQPKVFSLREDTSELIAAQLPSEIVDDARHRGNRDPVDQRPVRLDQIARPVPRDPLRSHVMPWHEGGDVDRLRRPRPKSPKPPRRVITQQRPRSHRQHGRERFPVHRQILVANRVNAPVNPMQPPGLDRPGDRPLGEAKRSFELSD